MSKAKAAEHFCREGLWAEVLVQTMSWRFLGTKVQLCWKPSKHWSHLVLVKERSCLKGKMLEDWLEEAAGLHSCVCVKGPALLSRECCTVTHNHKDEVGKATPYHSSVCERVWTRSSHPQSPVSHLLAPLDHVSSMRPSCIKFLSVPLIVSYLLLQICFTSRNESQLSRASWDAAVGSADTIRLGAHAVRHPSVYPSKTFPCECCEFTAIASSLPRTDFVYPLAI